MGTVGDSRQLKRLPQSHSPINFTSPLHRKHLHSVPPHPPSSWIQSPLPNSKGKRIFEMGYCRNHGMLLFGALIVIAGVIIGAKADAVVSGTVFCDQCKDGHISLFDYPLNGIKVKVTCTNNKGQVTLSGEETTNTLGNYAIKFHGTPDLSSCQAQVIGNWSKTGCSASAGPSKGLRLMFNMFDTEFYSVDSLLAQPARPKSFCPSSASPAPATPLPPAPFLEPSACPSQKWTMPEYKCYWKVVSPDTKVALVFGPVAAQRYGADLTLWQALHGRGEAYRTLLREATTSLLNSYNSVHFPYNSIVVVQQTNDALLGSSKNVLHTALAFTRANSGSACKFTPCK
ncbi:hypothetical protein MLD38_026770 [Melastoma candidum]|uniref:Uncharacterized protein n=1 Tax=Melastoma candidum TaxID=119954 RepID=A0ACB9P042_9MYRT|nr:hypothetical protein MLD38_026770 [Melastoma candidum]